MAGQPLRAQPVPLDPAVSIRRLMTVGSNGVRLVTNPIDGSLYCLKGNGEIYRLTINPGTNTSTSTLLYTSSEHGLPSAIGFTVGPDGTIYLMGNQDVLPGKTSRMRLVKGVLPAAGPRVWSVLAETVAYPKSATAFDHAFAGLLVTGDGQFILATSGSRTDHGEVESNSGSFPNTREVPLTAVVLKLPLNAAGTITLQNDKAWLVANKYLFAEGVRNTFDLAYGPNGDIFGTDNGPDADYPEKINWLREGGHFGFPWRLGGLDNRTRFAGYNYDTDRCGTRIGGRTTTSFMRANASTTTIPTFLPRRLSCSTAYRTLVPTPTASADRTIARFAMPSPPDSPCIRSRRTARRWASYSIRPTPWAEIIQATAFS